MIENIMFSLRLRYPEFRFVAQFRRYRNIIAVMGLFGVPSIAAAQTFDTPGSWNYTVPAGVSTIQLQIAGGGGGGGGADSARGGDGSAGAQITAVVAVTPGQTLSGTVGGGGVTGHTSGDISFGFGPPCTGGGGGGSGFGAGGAGANTNCPGAGYSGGGGGGGGGTTFALNGTILLQAGGGGGGGGGANGPIGGNGASNISLTTAVDCNSFGSGANATTFNGDGGGGGGGGGGHVGGAAGTSHEDWMSSTGGIGGSNCRSSATAVISTSVDANGGSGAPGATVSTATSGPGGANGYVRIIASPLSVQKRSVVMADGISLTNPKAVPGSTVQYCIVVTNRGFVDSTSMILADPLPPTTNYVTDSAKSGSNCGNATTTPADGVSITATTLTANVGTLAAGESYAVTFEVMLD